jgi:hypothetical protein
MRRKDPWLRAGFDLWALWAESSAVIALRMAAIAGGGPIAEAESRLMVDEKIAAALDLQTRMLTGGLGPTASGAAGKTIALYRCKVRANRKRLSKKKK